MNRTVPRCPSPTIRRLLSAGSFALAVISLSGCQFNVFDPLDSPSGDEQLLSAARACFDRGDFACARENYGKLSGSLADTATAEKAFITLDEQGASMAAYMEFVGDLTDSGTGPALTNFANRLASTAGVSKRTAIWDAFNTRNSISNTNLKNFVQFVGGMALAAEILAEAASDRTKLYKTNLVTSVSGCTVAACAASANCNQPSSATMVTVDVASIATTSPSNTSAALEYLFEAIDLAYQGLSGLDASGKFSNTVTAFNTLRAVGTPSTAASAQDRCFRANLIGLSVGG